MIKIRPRTRAKEYFVLVALMGFTGGYAQEHPGDETPGEEGVYFLTDPAEVNDELDRATRSGVSSFSKVYKSAGMNMDSDDSPAVCRAVLEHAAHVYASEFSLDDRKAWAYAKSCGSSSNSRNAAVSIVLEELPISFEAGEENKRKWCDENEKLSTSTQAYQRIENKVMALAIQNWAQCVDSFKSGLVTRVNVSNTDRAFQVSVMNRTNNDQSITKLNVLSDEEGGIECDKNIPPDVVIKPNEYANFVCTRSYVDVERQGQTFQVLPGGTVTFSNTVTPYFYSFNERIKKDAMPEPTVPKKILLSLTGSHIGTKAYWARGTVNAVQYCTAQRIDVPRDDYDLVSAGTTEITAWGRGLCAKPPFCDSHGEICKELYYTTACYINKDWHDNYKQEVADNKWQYSLAQVCSP